MVTKGLDLGGSITCVDSVTKENSGFVATPSWIVSTKMGKLDNPYDNGHGGMVTQGVTEISWLADSKDSVLLDTHYDEFVFRGRVPKESGPMWFKIFQGCENGSTDWAEIPASGTSTKELKTPAALLEILPPK